uniref:Uncharacterized protein n=1 Tax=Anguilla anguilla TaxID=7936 RepID=A0A0E9P7C4_ANGAN
MVIISLKIQADRNALICVSFFLLNLFDRHAEHGHE